MTNPPLLQVNDLTIAYRNGRQTLQAVRDFSLTMAAGETYGLVGESGSGKSTIALTVMRYLGAERIVQKGEVWLNGRNLLHLTEPEMGRIWGRLLNFVPQDPLSSLNPSMLIGEQIAELLRYQLGMGETAVQAKTLELLHMVRVPDPARVAGSYPHQISGGMQQRVMIAMALSTEPPLLVLDEPTTNLDVTTQAAVLDLLRDLMAERGTAVLYVSHNLGVVAQLCRRVAVLYAGELVEDSDTTDLFRQPLHPYTQGLLRSIPQLGQNKANHVLASIPGQVPSLGNRPPGCVFAPRCDLALEKCHHERPFLEAASSSAAANHHVRCHRWPEIARGDITLPLPPASPLTINSSLFTINSSLAQLTDVEVHFATNRSLLNTLTGQPLQPIRAVDGVSLDLRKGQTIGLVGESGSGKTTLARAIIGLAERTNGRIELLNLPLPTKLSTRTIETLRHLQYVFQNPEEALNPTMTIGETLQRPFITLLNHSREQAAAEAEKLLTAVRLPAHYKDRLSGQLSGGEKQRVAIARAFATNPDLLIADEAVSALDVSVQASILNLLRDLQAEHGNTLLFISHDLAVIGYLADTIAVMYLGRLMEVTPATELFQPPTHPYTEALLSAIPLTEPGALANPIRLQGDVPSQMNERTGCPFASRCPRVIGPICHQTTPPWQTLPNGKQIFCHIPAVELTQTQQALFTRSENSAHG